MYERYNVVVEMFLLYGIKIGNLDFVENVMEFR